MEKTTKFLKDAKEKMKNKQYKDAIEDLDVAIMLNQQCFEAHLMIGLCYEKLENDQKSLASYQFAQELKPDDLTVNQALAKQFAKLKQTEKEIQYLEIVCNLLQKSQPQKYEEQVTRLLLLYEMNEDLQKTYDLFLSSLQENNQLSVNLKLNIAKSFFKLAADAKSINMQEVNKFIAKYKGADACYLLDEAIDIIMSYFSTSKLKQEEILSNLLCLIHGFPQSAIALKYQLHHVIYLLKLDKLSFQHAVDSAIQFVVANEIQDQQIQQQFKLCKYQHYKKKNEKACIQVLKYCKIFLSFSVSLSDKSLLGVHDQNVYKLVTDNIIDPITDENDQDVQEFILIYPYLINQALLNRNNPRAKQLFNDFDAKLKEISQRFDIDFLEDQQQKLNLRIFEDIESLLQMKYTLKVRLRKDFKNIEILKCFYECQMKLVQYAHQFDEEVDINLVVNTILDLDKENTFYLSEKCWMEFSSCPNSQKEQIHKKVLEQLQASLQLATAKKDKVLISKIKKRIGTIKFIFKCQEKEGEVLEIWQDAAAQNASDYQIYICLAIYSYQQGDYDKCKLHLEKAFIINQYDIQLNKLIFFIFQTMGFQDEAIDFADRIYPPFQNIFWLNCILGIHYSNNGNFQKAENYIQRALEIFQNDKSRNYQNYYEKQEEFQEFSIPYFISQNAVKFLDDYPILSDPLIERKAEIMSIKYSKSKVEIKELRLWIVQTQINKFKGQSGSALKSLEAAEELAFKIYAQDQAVKGDENLQILREDDNTKFVIQTFDIYSKIFYSHKSLISKYIGIKGFGIDVLLLNHLYAEVHFYTKNYFDCSQRIKIFLILAAKLIHETKSEDQKTIAKIQELFNDMLCLIFEMGTDYIAMINGQQSQAIAQSVVRQFSLIAKPKLNKLNAFSSWSDFQFLKYNLLKDVQDLEQVKIVTEDGLKFVSLEFSTLQDLDKVDVAKLNFVLNCMDNCRVEAIHMFLSDLILIEFQLYEETKNKQYMSHALQLSKLGMQLFQTSITFLNLYGLLEDDIKIKIGAFVKSIKINSRNTVAIDNLAQIYIKYGRYEDGIKLFLKSLEIDPLNTKAYIGIISVSLVYALQSYAQILEQCIFSETDESQRNFDAIAQIDFIIQKCSSYLTLIHENEVSSTSLMLQSIIELINQQYLKSTQELTDNKSFKLKKDNILTFIYNLQLFQKQPVSISDPQLGQLFKSLQTMLNQIPNANKTVFNNGIFEKYINLFFDNFSQFIADYEEQLNQESQSLIKMIEGSNRQYFSEAYRFIQHLKNIYLYILFQLSQKKKIKQNCNQIIIYCIQNLSKCKDIDQISMNSCQIEFMSKIYKQILTSYFHLLKKIQADHQQIQRVLLLLANLELQINDNIEIFKWQLKYLCTEEPPEISNLSYYNYLQGIWLQQINKQTESKRKFYLALLYQPNVPKYRDAIQVHSISVQRQLIPYLESLNKYDCVQYEKYVIYNINNAEKTLQQKICFISQAAIYLNSPNIWYLMAHYSFEDIQRHTPKYLHYIFQILLNRVIKQYPSDQLKRKVYKTIIEIYWRLHNIDPNSQYLPIILDYLNKAKQESQYLAQFEQKVIFFLEKQYQAAQIDQLKDLLKEKPLYDQLKILFDICKNLFQSSKGAQLLDMMQTLKGIILDTVGDDLPTKNKNKLKCMLEYLNTYIYILAQAENFNPNSKLDKVTLLETLTQAADECQLSSITSPNLSFICMHNLYEKNNMDELDQWIQYFANGVIKNRKDQLISCYFDMLYTYNSIVEGKENSSADYFEEYIQMTKNEYYYELNSSIKSVFYYMHGIIQLKNAEVNLLDKKTLTKNFKLAVLYRPDCGLQILQKFK